MAENFDKPQFEQQYNEALGGKNSSADERKTDNSNKLKDPENWSTGYEPMTEAQRSYLQTLMELHGERLDENLTKAQAAELIDLKKQNISVPPPYEQTGNFWHTLKEPDEWRTGDEPATPSQLSYLETLARQAGKTFTPPVSKAEASKQIETLRKKTGLAGDEAP